MDFQVLTNNPLVYERLKEKYAVTFLDCGYRELLCRARDNIHQGYRLYSHPLSGSIKPNETPYKSLLLSKTAEKLDVKSLALIENGIEVFDKFSPLPSDLPARIREDFALVDYSLLESALAR